MRSSGPRRPHGPDGDLAPCGRRLAQADFFFLDSLPELLDVSDDELVLELSDDELELSEPEAELSLDELSVLVPEPAALAGLAPPSL